MRKARCKRCRWLDYSFLDDKYEQTDEHFCGMHGMAPVDPEGEQPNLDHHGGCGYSEKEQYSQLSINFEKWS